MRSKKFWLSATVTSLITAGILSYPTILRWQVEKRIPKGVTFSDVSLGTSGVTLKNVNIQKDWISGHLDTITSDFDGKNITVTGGELTATLDSRSRVDTAEGQKRNISFRNLELQITQKDHKITLNGVRSEDKKICFSGAKLASPPITTSEGCFDRENGVATIKEANLEELNLMGTQIRSVTAHNITYNTREKIAEVGNAEGNITFEKQTFSIEAKGIKASRHPDTMILETLKVLHSWLSSDWITMENVGIQHSDRWDIKIGQSHVQVEPKTLTLSGTENCNSWIDSLPESLKTGPLDKIRMTGKTSFSIGFRPKPSFQLRSDCRATCSSLPNLRAAFRYTAYTPKSEPFERESGPGSKGWLSLRMMGDMPLAVTNMEDPGFEHHRGFITQAFFNSFTDNLKQGKFLRGGSTITMQLAKNLWLNRDKTLGRKIQEFFLAQGLESCYSKDEIMELYLNVIEFGPNKYGLGAGASHWFKKGPGELEPQEAFWLASILPKPSRTGLPTNESLDRIKAMMKRLSDDGKIPDFMSELEEQLQEAQ